MFQVDKSTRGFVVSGCNTQRKVLRGHVCQEPQPKVEGLVSLGGTAQSAGKSGWQVSRGFQ
ncbi:hypothetical protein E2C01_082848 [Portunus trituberculatus]|uniref:Uncharacterized protein n=1 Tax=Portunus trituberculatus TaxID=210409 RepID=A0A5B7J0D2_PORTR|nr:hypothetical protein [Portunus trituberculatus]